MRRLLNGFLVFALLAGIAAGVGLLHAQPAHAITYVQKLYPLLATSKERVYSGHFVGIDAADPTTKVIGLGVTVTRSGEGVWVVTLPKPLAGFKGCYAKATDDDGAFHSTEFVTSVSGRTVTITHKTVAYASIASGPSAQDVVDEVDFTCVVILSDTGANL
jgi:hypothetical protein